MPNSKKAPSLRRRYFFTTVIVCISLVAAASYNYIKTFEINDKATSHLAATDKHLAAVEDLHHQISHTYQLLDQFLLDPIREGILAQLESDGLNRLDDRLARFENDDFPATLHPDLQALRSTVEDYKDTIRLLVRTRLDSGIQYPAMALSAEGMASHQRTVLGNLGILIGEIENGDFVPESPRIYPLLLKAQTAWVSCIAQMRIYLANRLASFSTDILIAQAGSLSNFMLEFQELVDQLIQLYQTEDSFEGPRLIADAKRNAEQWYAIFHQVREINESEEWRQDKYLMTTQLIPTFDALHDGMEQITSELRAERYELEQLLAENSRRRDHMLTAFIVVFVAFVTVVLFSMEVMIFRPVSKVTQALKSRAFGIENPQFYRALSLETQQLVEAFDEMNVEVRNRERALQHHSLHDPLTGLPNRFMLTERLKYHLNEAQRNKASFTLFLIDLNEFKEINDSLGHQTGDALLVAVGTMLKERARGTDTVARLGGDEFAIVLPRTERKNARVFASTIGASFKNKFQIGSYSILADASIGIACYPDDGPDADTLLQHADVAMYEAKRKKQSFAFYDPKFDDNSPVKIALIGDLRSAIDNHELELYYHPQLDLKSDRIYGAEALLRWNHPRFGFVNPERIIEIAERTGLMDRLTYWVLEQALAHCAECHAAGSILEMSINVSAKNLENGLFPGQVKEILSRHTLDPKYLTLEVTETAVMSNPGRAVDILTSLAQLGVKLSIDDFGTGFSSLTYLKQLPVHELKIDKSFVMHMDQSENDRIIVKSTIELGHNLGLSVVAEGIETESVYLMLRDMGCEAIQGYLLSKPLPKNSFIRWLRSREDSRVA